MSGLKRHVLALPLAVFLLFTTYNGFVEGYNANALRGHAGNESGDGISACVWAPGCARTLCSCSSTAGQGLRSWAGH